MSYFVAFKVRVQLATVWVTNHQLNPLGLIVLILTGLVVQIFKISIESRGLVVERLCKVVWKLDFLREHKFDSTRCVDLFDTNLRIHVRPRLLGQIVVIGISLFGGEALD